jgi:hypothetical protein
MKWSDGIGNAGPTKPKPRPWQDPTLYIVGLEATGSPIFASVDHDDPWTDGEPATQGELQELYRLLNDLWDETE